MSGIYLTLWDEDRRHESHVLKPNKGGWPHITLAWTGKELPLEVLLDIAGKCFPGWARKPVTLMRVYLTSFEDPPGVVQHRVLIELSDMDKIFVEQTRDAHIRPYANSEKFAMRLPHITHSVHASLA